MKTGFVIVNYNDYETTSKLLENIKNYKCIDLITVVDNNSSDNSFNLLKKYENNKINIIKNSSNKGYGSGINYGSKHLINRLGDCYIIVSNPDIVIYKEEDLIKLINSFDDKTAMVGPIIKEHTGLNRGWKVPTPLQDAILNIIFIHRFLRPKMLFYKKNYYKGIVPVEAITGCFFIINSADLKEVNYFDENVFLYYEENIMAKKIYRKIVVNSDVTVFHNHSVTIDKNISKIRKYKELKKSQMYFHKKYSKANKLELAILYITNKTTLLLLYIKSIFKK